MKVYVGMDMAKDKFDYCAMDDSLNVICRGSNRENRNERFHELSDLIRTMEYPGVTMKIGMEFTGIYHIPLYNHLRTNGFTVRILNGLEVRGMKKSRIRKTSNDTIDAESIARYLMIMEDREAFVVPDNLRNLREIITAYGTVTGKIRTAKNNLIRAMDMIFPGLSNTVVIDQDTLDMLSRYIGPEDFLTADQEDIRKYVSRRRTERIRKIASDAPTNACTDKALRMEISSLIRILKVLMEEKERFENAEKLVAFAGIDPVIKESGKQRSQRAISKRGDPTLRSALYQSALAAIRGNPAISEFYHRKIEGGMPRKKAMVAASRKQCHIIWSVWHNNKPFELPEKFRKQE